MDAIFTSGIFMSFFIALLLFTKKNKALTDRILAVWMLLIGTHLLSYYLYHLGFWDKYPHMVGITAPFPLIHGPMLYLYTLYSLRSDAKIRKVDYFHFLPAVLGYVSMFEFFFFYSPGEKRMVDKGMIDDFAWTTAILLVAFIISGLTYSVIAFRLTWKHKKKVDENFSYEEGINLNWLRYCIYGIGFIFLSATIIIVLREGIGLQFSFNADFIFYTLIILFIFYIGYFGIRHQDMFTHNTEAVPVQSSVSQTEKYKKSGLSEESLLSGHQKLLEYMVSQKPYLDPKLTLGQLAGKLEMSANQLSQIINRQEAVNFHDFVNRFRINEFISRATKNENFSLLAHALDSGFNSKSSFNSIFKKHKGTTPSQFLKSGCNQKP